MAREPLDIRIVGGGLAGTITGLTLLNGRRPVDARVTVYEREAEPYTTLCGEGLSDTTLRMFGAFDSTPYVAEAFEGAAWYFPGDVKVQVNQRCYTMARERWIPAMAEALRKAGAIVKTGAKVTVEQVEEMAREADVVIGADGPGSVVRRFVGGEHETMLGIQYRLPRDAYDTDRLEFYTDKRYSPEYSWIFPRGNQHNVGLLATGDGKDWQRLDAFMRERGVKGRILKREAYPIGFFGTTVQRGNVVLIGDAAGLTNPVTKGGMAAVIYAAEILAECLSGSELERYDERIFSHPLTDPSFRKAVEIIHRWTNRDFEKLTRFAPKVMATGERVSATRRYAVPFALTCLANPWAIRDLRVLAHAMGVSRRYSW